MNNISYLQLDEVSYSYGNKKVLDDLTWVIKPGKVSVLLGPNGAGKTTLLNLLAGVTTPSQGHVLLFGEELGIEKEEFKQKIGYLPEFPFFYDQLTVVEMLRLVGQLRKIEKSTLEMQIEMWVENFQLTEYRNKSIRELSQGTKKRVALACVLLHEPKVLILDEPTNGLDPEQVIIFRKTLESQAKQGCIVLLSTHIMGLAEKVADDVAVLRNGRFQYTGTSSGNLEDLYLGISN